MNVALVGFGTVGQAAARLMAGRSDLLRLTHVCNRQVARKRVDWLPGVTWTDRFDDVLHADVDVVVELIGGLDPAGTWVQRALEAGKSVVTANKQLIATRGTELLTLASKHQRHLGFEAAVAGGIPVIRAIREGLAADEIECVSGILNGTCNYILTQMESTHRPFDVALAEAQQKGFAEADPTDDLDGYDARAKLCILARVGLRTGLEPASVSCRSIRPVRDLDFVYGGRLGCTIRQVSRVQRADEAGRVVAWVQPVLVRHTSPLARVSANQNMVLVQGRTGGETTYSGFGAGGGPTAVAVLSDLIAIAEHGHSTLPERMTRVALPSRVSQDFRAPYYLRFVVRDRPGIIAAIAVALAKYDINIDSVLQEPSPSKQGLPFVVTLEESDPVALGLALGEIAAHEFHVEPPLALPIIG
ncbi:MAG: homoserine dehydrogenase [Vicinamibacterales bacterium]